MSVGLHLLLLFLIATNLRAVGAGDGPSDDGDYREVGLVVRADSETFDESTDPTADPTTETPIDPVATSDPEVSFQPDDSSDAPPALSDSNLLDGPILGPGAEKAGPTVPTANTPPSNIRPTAGMPNFVPPSSAGDGGVSFFGIDDEGDSFAYVLDVSGSMKQAHGAVRGIDMARAELKRSLKSLKPDQKFAVILYNSSAWRLQLPNVQAVGGFYRATALNITKASRQIDQIAPDLGTQHFPAVRMGLDLAPDVMFVLSDAVNERLTSQQLAAIRVKNQKENGGRTRIHAVEFTVELADPTDGNFLQALAAQNNGSYRRRDLFRRSRGEQ